MLPWLTASATRRRAQSAHGGRSNGERRGWGCGRRNAPRVGFSGSNQPPRARRNTPLGVAPQGRTPERGLAKDAVRPGCNSWETAVRERERNAVRPVATSSATKPRGTASQRQASGPSPLASRPEHVETAVPLLLFSSCAAGVGKRPGALSTLQPQSEGSAKLVCAPQVIREG